jgi:hypothetical protein
MSFLIFQKTGTSKSGLTNIWEVCNTSGECLGKITWKATWRRYWFEPAPGTGFDGDCLQDIKNFIVGAMQEKDA